MSQEPGRFFHELREAGRLDSQGSFTLDRAAACRKLGRSLPEPRAYILKLVQWAVRSRPSVIKIEIRHRRVSVSHDGARTAPEEVLDGLVHPLGTRRPGLLHLATGLHAVLELEASRLSLENEQGSWELLAGESCGPPGPPGWTTVILENIRPQRLLEKSPMLIRSFRHNAGTADVEGPLISLLSDATGLRRIEGGMVRQLCYLAPIPVLLNGRPVNRPLLGAPCLYLRRASGLDLCPTAGRLGSARFLLARSQTPANLLAPAVRFRGMSTHWVTTDPLELESALQTSYDEQGVLTRIGFGQGLRPARDHGELLTLSAAELEARATGTMTLWGQPMLACHAAYYYPRQIGGSSAAIWVKDGVVVEEESGLFPAVVYSDASSLETDLSGFSLIRNQDYWDRINWLTHWAPPP
ncbi:MAG: hypothetical protein HY319_21735 [Armatimonadetes bacterium]|nr:hypothetical protein [Armatimonadota bacterium]